MTTLRWPAGRRRTGAVSAPLPIQPLLALLSVLALVMSPFLARLPLWLSLLLALLLTGRAALALRGLKQPPAWVLVLVALLVSRLLAGTYSTLAGRDGGTAMLLLLVALKTLEVTRRRHRRRASHARLHAWPERLGRFDPRASDRDARNPVHTGKRAARTRSQPGPGSNHACR